MLLLQEKEVESTSPKITLDLKAEKFLAGRDLTELAGEEVVTAVSSSFYFEIALGDNRRFQFAPRRLIKCHDSLFKCV